MSAPPPGSRAPVGIAGIWPRRAALAVAGPLLFLLLTEASLRLARFGHSTHLFVPEGTPGVYRTNPHFTSPFLPDAFDIAPLDLRLTLRKPPGAVRVFVLGESAARGVPEPGFGIAEHLRAQLRRAYPQKAVEVYNLGIVAINSHAVLQAAIDAAAFEPDLFVVYMGNNEVIGPFGPGSVTGAAVPPVWVARLSHWVAGTRTGQLMALAIRSLTGPPVAWRGMGTFSGRTVGGEDGRLEGVYRNFEGNLRSILAAARGCGARVVLTTVVANLADCAPFASVHSRAFEGARQADWSRLEAEGLRLWESDEPEASASALRAALAVDPGFAESHFVLGKDLEALGDAAGARREWLQALHWDALRFRPDPEINAVIRRVAASAGPGVRLVDASLEFGADAASDAPAAGSGLLWEHVHLNWEGNRRLGLRLAQESAGLLFAGEAHEPWLDAEGAARALGYTVFGRENVLRTLTTIRDKPPFTSQVTFAEDALRHVVEGRRAVADAAAPGASSEALGRVREAVRADPRNAELALRLAEVAVASQEPELALEALDTAAGLRPPNADLRVRRAQTLVLLGRLEEAEDEIARAVAAGPNHLPAYTEMVDIARRSQRFERAAQALRGALARSPSSDYLRLTEADLLFFEGRTHEAVRRCRSVLDRDPSSAEALGRLVSLATAEGRNDDAWALRVRAERDQPLNFENNMALARGYKSRGDRGGEAASLERAARCGPAEPEVHVFLARESLAAGALQQALLEFSRARRAALIEDRPAFAAKVAEMIAAVPR